ncbi:MAG: dihydropteroate synthase [Polyangiales bacterium]
MFTRPPLRLGETVWDWSRPYLLGIVNVTPDSFSDGGLAFTTESAVAHALRLVAEGADALDLGGESTRPDARPVSADEELARVIPVIEALRGRVSVPLSIDTTKAAVAEAALSAGACVVNDTGVGDDVSALGAVAARHGAAYVAMHARGAPSTMRALARYDDVVSEVRDALLARADALSRAGGARERILLDPGLGFAKTAEHSLTLLANLGPIRALGFPLCVGASRKSFIVADGPYPQWPRDESPPRDRVGGTAAAVALSVAQGAEVHRVHDVAVARQAARVAHAVASRSLT